MTNQEITEFIKELKEVSEEIIGIVDDEVYGLIKERNQFLAKAADLIEEQQGEIFGLKGMDWLY